MDKLAPSGMSFPFNFGSIPSTKAPDGDPLDMVVLFDQPLLLGCLVGVRLLGVIEAVQTLKSGERYRNDRLIGIASKSKDKEEKQKAPTERQFAQIENFFVRYNRAQGRTFKVLGRFGAKRAEGLIRKSSQ
jgi:inorganic pyrophosphatase